MVVAGPGDRLGAHRTRLAARVGRTQPPGGVRLLPQHQLQPFHELLPPAGAAVVGRGRGGVELGRAHRLQLGEPGATHRREIREERLHHIPGRDLGALQTGPHPFRITSAEDAVPAPRRIEQLRQMAQISRELAYGHRRLMHRHRRPRPPSAGTFQSAGIRPQMCYGTATHSFRPGCERRTASAASAPAEAGARGSEGDGDPGVRPLAEPEDHRRVVQQPVLPGVLAADGPAHGVRTLGIEQLYRSPRRSGRPARSGRGRRRR